MVPLMLIEDGTLDLASAREICSLIGRPFS
jgi:hypothetical protein